MRWSALFILSFSFMLSACFSPESKLEAVVEKEIGKAQLLHKARLELDKVLGKKDSKLKSSLLKLVDERTKIEFVETVIDGKRARVHVRAVVPRFDELGALILLGSFVPREQLLNMSADEFLQTLSRNSRQPASASDLRSEIYSFSVDFSKEKTWKVNEDQLSRAYSRRNLISKNIRN
jgi:hypothetical protein